MDDKSLEEVKGIVEHAAQGNWFPFAIVCACLGLIVVLFIYILKMKDKANQNDHKKTDSILEKLTENTSAMNVMIQVHETEINNLKAS